VWLIWFHPLSHFPGPKLAIISNIFYSRAIISGRSAKIVKSLHDKYGDIVRWGPNELSFANKDAWKDIYDRRKDGKILIKDPWFYRTDDTIRAKHIVSTNDPQEHAAMRKMMSYAFSAKALLEQEDLIQQYADDLCDAVRERGPQGPINLVEFFNWTTFDVLGELAFGEPFNSLKNRKTDSWIEIILDSIKFNAWDVAIWKLPIVPYFQYWLTPKHIREGGVRHAIQSKEKILKRAKMGTKRIDFVSYILEKREELKITDWELAG
jgi:cytochrome P450